MTQIDEPNLDEQIDKIIEMWDFSPFQDEDSRIERVHKEIKALIATQIQEARIDEIKRMREGMTFAHMTPSIYAAERIKNILGEIEL